jgi:hypothetical protein
VEARRGKEMTQYYIVLNSPHGSDYALFWRSNEEGYTRIIDKAGKYSEDDAKRICRMRGKEFMVPCEVVEKAAVRVADFGDLFKYRPMGVVNVGFDRSA